MMLKPPLWAPGIDLSHPLAGPTGLVFSTPLWERGGKVHDLIRRYAGTLEDGALWVSEGVNFEADVAAAVNMGNISAFSGLSKVSFVSVVHLNSNATGAVASEHDISTSPWHRSWYVYLIAGSSFPKARVIAFRDGDANNYTFWQTDADAVPINETSVLICSMDLEADTGVIYVNGVSQPLSKTVSLSGHAGSLPDVGIDMLLGNYQSASAKTNNLDGRIEYFGGYDRILSSGQVAHLTARPYQFLRPADDLPLWAAATSVAAAGGDSIPYLLRLKRKFQHMIVR